MSSDVANVTESTAAKPKVGLKWPWLLVGLAGTLWIYLPVFRWLMGQWSSNSDYSHGYLVPLFAGYLLWSSRARIKSGAEAGQNDGVVLGVGLLLFAVLLHLSGTFLRVLTLEGLSLIPFLMGVASIVLGRQGVRWLAPGACFLIFMIPLPGFLSGQLSGLLQTVATQVSTFSLQTLGVPAIADGNVISLTNGQIGVAEACSGLRMLYAFFALTVGACLLIDRTPIEKGLIVLSAIPIAIAANCLRIIATGAAYEYLDSETAEHIFHDVAGWLMMPLGFLFLLGGLAILDRLIVPEESDDYSR